MAKVSGVAVIQQKIDLLNRQITHFEACINNAKQNIATLQQAVVALESDPFSLSATPMLSFNLRRKEKETDIYISPYARRSREFIAKVLKAYPNQWLSAREMMFKAFEIEGNMEQESCFHSIVTAFSHVLRRLNEQGIVERQELQEKSSVKVIQWRLKEVSL